MSQLGFSHGGQAKLFSYLHQRADLKVSRGNIPVGFYSCMFLGGNMGHITILGYKIRNIGNFLGIMGKF